MTVILVEAKPGANYKSAVQVVGVVGYILAHPKLKERRGVGTFAKYAFDGYVQRHTKLVVLYLLPLGGAVLNDFTLVIGADNLACFGG